MILYRRIGSGLLVVAALAVWFLFAPSEVSSDDVDFGAAADAAMADYELNNSAADSAPQQQVVNGWVTKDLLEVLVRQQQAALAPDSLSRDERVPAYLLLAVLGLALLAATSGSPTATRDSVSADPSV